MNSPDGKTLLVCWDIPQNYCLSGADILSFLTLSAEASLRDSISGRFHVAREIAPSIKNEARDVYRELIAGIGATPIPESGGKTFRELLRFESGGSYWWFHKVSEKDCESDRTFDDIIQLLIISHVAKTNNYSRIILVGGCTEYATVLNGAHSVIVTGAKQRYAPRVMVAKALAGRVKYAVQCLLRLVTAKRHYRHPEIEIDVALAGFWDWSVREEAGVLNDRYFKSLPEKLSAHGSKVGWFLWLDPFYESSGRNRRLKDVIGTLKRHKELVLLQGFLGISDLLMAVLNLRPYLIYRKCIKHPGFRRLFRAGEMDLFPLLHPLLSFGFLNATLPNHELIFLASRRAAARYRPSKTISFLEFFLHSRAFYLGCRLGRPEVTNITIQHASYCREKTFSQLDRVREYDGYPDNLPIPSPDYLFAMGEEGRAIFIESGLPPERVVLTGSSRYEHVSAEEIRVVERYGNRLHLLLVTSLDVNAEMEMIEAVCLATEGISDVRLRLRNHPFARVDQHPDFPRYGTRIEVSYRSLEEDLADTDLVLFTSTTIAEESFIRGVAAWQWSSCHYNGSIFRDIGIVPSYTSVASLKESLEMLIRTTDRMKPSLVDKEIVERKCFYRADGNASKRIADFIASI